MNTYTFNLIQKARYLLYNAPYDLAHEINHHYKVWENVLSIASQENILSNIQLEPLYVACWWHDIDRDTKAHQLLRDQLIAEKTPQEFNDKVLEIINNHSFGENSEISIEAKLIYDADKLEYIGIARWEYLRLANLNNQMSDEVIQGYCNDVNVRIEKVKNTLYFETTKKMFQTNVQVLSNYFKFLPNDAVYNKYIDKTILNKII
ncbi:MAG: HD domain-containing protein [bacterium]|nr:HD domain-containing protein [bacterium]